MKITPAKVKKLITDPSQAAEFVDLQYITEAQLSIARQPHGRGFYYTFQEKKITDKKAIKRFKALVIPPAWRDVRITPIENGHLQVIGKDDKNRKQYRYHAKWNEIRNKTKFYKMIAFGQALPAIRAQVEKDLQLPTMTKRKCLALVLKLMEETHIRIGNKYYARKNKTYGLSTMRTKHLEVNKNKVTFNFKGKKGKPHEVSVTSKKLRKLIIQCEEIPGWELFQYYDEDGKHHTIDSGMVNDYIHELSGDIFSAKDFRTWAGSKVFFETLAHLGIAKKQKTLDANLIKAYDAAAKALNNTRAVCRSSYVHPVIANSYSSKTIRPYFETIATNTPANYLSKTETSLLKLLKTYEINIVDSQ